MRERGDTGGGDLMAMDSGVVGCREVGWERTSGVQHRHLGIGEDMDSLVAMCLVKSRSGALVGTARQAGTREGSERDTRVSLEAF